MEVVGTGARDAVSAVVGAGKGEHAGDAGARGAAVPVDVGLGGRVAVAEGSCEGGSAELDVADVDVGACGTDTPSSGAGEVALVAVDVAVALVAVDVAMFGSMVVDTVSRVGVVVVPMGVATADVAGTSTRDDTGAGGGAVDEGVDDVRPAGPTSGATEGVTARVPGLAPSAVTPVKTADPMDRSRRLTWTWSMWFAVGLPRSGMSRHPSVARSTFQMCCCQMT